jgi:hypothetical protein
MRADRFAISFYGLFPRITHAENIINPACHKHSDACSKCIRRNLGLNTNDAQVNVTEKFLVAKGLFSCAACDPPVKDFPADGQPHKALGAPYYDAATVRVVDGYTVEFTTTRNGKPVEYMKIYRFARQSDGRARRSFHFRKWTAKP